MGASAQTFAQRVQEWQLFYATLSGVTATLVGLLFVALFVNVDLFVQEEHHYLKRTSRMVFGSFVLVLFCSLMFLIPHQNPWGLSMPLFFSSLAAIADTIHAFLEIRRPLKGLPAADARKMRRGLFRAFVGRVALAIASLLFLLDIPGVFFWVMVPMLGALLSACRNCWDLLVGVRERIPH